MSDNHEEISVEELYKIASGMASDKSPNAAAQVSRIKGGEAPDVIREVILDGAVLYFHVFAGCAVIKAEMPATSRFAWQNAKIIYEDWLKDKAKAESDDAFDEYMVMTIFPVALDGNVFPQFPNLVYAEFYEGEKGSLHAIFCYDNISSSVFLTEGIDINAINAEIDAELMRQEEEMNEEIEALEEEEKNLDKEITKVRFGDFAKGEVADINKIIESKEGQKEEASPSHEMRNGFRFGGDDSQLLGHK